MKRFLLILLSLALLCLCIACGRSDESPTVNTTDSAQAEHEQSSEKNENTENFESEVQEPMEKNEQQILIAYFSHTGNTEVIAEEIQRLTGGELFEIEAAEPYPDSYDETVERFRRERDENARPAIAEDVTDMDSYDIVFIGYPNWGDDMPHIVYTFLEQYDFSGKTIIPFCTNGGGGFGNSIANLTNTCPDSEIADGFECSGRNVQNEKTEVYAWLNSLGIETAQ